MTEHFFTTTAGIKIKIEPISLLDLRLAQDAIEDEFKSRGEPIDPPTYEVEVLGGEKEYHPHTEVTIQDATDEEKEAWQKYLEALERLQDETQKRTGIVYLEGIIFDMPKGDAWVKRRKKLFNEDVPEDEDERKLHYVNKVLLKTPADQTGLMLEIQKLSMTGVSEEATEAMEQLFRSQMEIQGRETVEQLKALIEAESEDMVLQSSVEGRADGKGEGDDKPPVQEPANRRSSRNDSSREYPKQDDSVGELPG
jgi:hypothetical protein